MRAPPPPPPNSTTATATSTSDSLLLIDDDYSYYCTILQDAYAAATDIAASPSASADMSRRRRSRGGARDRTDDGDEDDRNDDGGRGGVDAFVAASAGVDKKKKRRRSIARILTSLVELDAQEESDLREADAASRKDLSLLEDNHQRKAEAMLDYYSHVQDHFSVVDEVDSLRSKRARLAATAVAASISEEVQSDQPEAPAASAASGGGQQQRRLWVKDRSRAWWDKCNHPDFPDAEFRRAFRMGRATFDMICEELGSAVAKEDTMLRAAIPVRQRVAVCIWRLATGEPLRLVSKRFGLGISTCHKLVLEVCSAIRTVLMPRFLQWPDEATIADIKSRYEGISGIPNVVGSMYTTHIPIIAPKISVAAYFNRRHTERNQKTSYSITVQGVVNPDGIFTDVCIGWPGSMPDHQVLEKSALYQRASAGMLKNMWIVGGPGYPLMDCILVPYTHHNLTWTQHAFNEKIGEVQRIAREAFALLKGRWSCLQKRTEVKLQDLPVFLGACCVLHNICQIRKEEVDPELKYQLVDDEMVPENPILSVSASQTRDNIAHNLLHCGLAGTTFF